MRLTLWLLMIGTMAIGQQSEMEKSDADALDILEKIKSDFESQNNHLIDFELLIEYPAEPAQKQVGQLLQKGDMFELTLDNRKVISDNKTVWLYLIEDNELQINDADFGDDGEYMSPNTIFRLYQSDDFIFAINNRSIEEGQAITQIECKPTDPDSEYSKMRLTVADAGHEVKRFKIFAKDGSRFTMTLLSHKKNIALKAGAFTFNTADYPGIIVEDLRF